MAQYLRDAILEHAPDHACGKNGVADKWARDIDLAIRRDKRTPEALKAAIDFAHRREDAFWRPNIQSGKKLRAQFDTLQAQAARTSRRAKALPENVAAVNSWLHRHGVDPDAERR